LRRRKGAVVGDAFRNGSAGDVRNAEAVALPRRARCNIAIGAVADRDGIDDPGFV